MNVSLGRKSWFEHASRNSTSKLKTLNDSLYDDNGNVPLTSMYALVLNFPRSKQSTAVAKVAPLEMSTPSFSTVEPNLKTQDGEQPNDIVPTDTTLKTTFSAN